METLIRRKWTRLRHDHGPAYSARIRPRSDECARIGNSRGQRPGVSPVGVMSCGGGAVPDVHRGHQHGRAEAHQDLTAHQAELARRARPADPSGCRLPSDLLPLTGLAHARWVVTSAGATAVDALAWPYSAAVLAVTALDRLLAKRARRETLLDLVTHAPAGTIVVMEKGVPGMVGQGG